MPGLPRIESLRCGPWAKYLSAARVSALPTAASSPQTKPSGSAIRAISDRNQSPLESPSAAEIQEPIVIGAESGSDADVDSMSPKNEAILASPVGIGRPQNRCGMCAAVFRIEAGEVVGPPAAARVLRAEAGVATDQLVGHLRAPEEVARRVHPDHHGPVDAPRVAPGVDHREPRARALAHEVDAAVAKRPAGGLEVVGLLGQRVAGEIDAVILEPRGAVAKRAAVGAVGLLAEKVGRALQGRRDLGQSSRTELSIPR